MLVAVNASKLIAEKHFVFGEDSNQSYGGAKRKTTLHSTSQLAE